MPQVAEWVRSVVSTNAFVDVRSWREPEMNSAFDPHRSISFLCRPPFVVDCSSFNTILWVRDDRAKSLVLR